MNPSREMCGFTRDLGCSGTRGVDRLGGVLSGWLDAGLVGRGLGGDLLSL